APADVAAAADPGPAPPGAILRSPRPAPRPGVTLASTGPVTAALPPSAEIAPEDIARGTRLVQVGAYGDAAEAIAAWDALRLQFGELLADKARVLQTATSGGRSFIRLRVHGFADEADARRFCSALLAENADCLPVLHQS
ncbi:MAG: SPOR domain-containing protein, partial [Rhodobacterales bacterium]|nr:SPOR domain-containing protein [Rhodobacterales bacterium]